MSRNWGSGGQRSLTHQTGCGEGSTSLLGIRRPMSSESKGAAFAGLQQLLVRRPSLITFGSFQQGLKDPVLRTRTKRAQEDWKVTDDMTVLSYSYSLDTLRIIFDDATLDVVAAGPKVEWSVRTYRLP